MKLGPSWTGHRVQERSTLLEVPDPEDADEEPESDPLDETVPELGSDVPAELETCAADEDVFCVNYYCWLATTILAGACRGWFSGSWVENLFKGSDFKTTVTQVR